jgi:putative ABC transport system permease protein
LRTAMQQIDRSQTLSNVQAVEQLMAVSTARWRVATLLIAIFAAAALLIAIIGIYGMTSYIVERRAKEAAIRMVLGAQRYEIFGLLLKSTALVTIAGVLLGIVSAFALTKFLVSLLYGVSPLDTTTFCFVPLGALFVTGLSSSVAAARALILEPSLALRSE